MPELSESAQRFITTLLEEWTADKYVSGRSAVDANGISVYYDSRAAVQWCATGYSHKLCDRWSDHHATEKEVIEAFQNQIGLSLEMSNDSDGWAVTTERLRSLLPAPVPA